jgi:hypothetical protein
LLPKGYACADCGPAGKPANWLDQEQKQHWETHWLAVLPFSAKQTTQESMLDFPEMTTAALEVLWRLLPPRALLARPSCVNWTARHQQQPGPEGVYDEGSLMALKDRASLLFLPVYCQGHWTLLVLERVGVVQPKEVFAGEKQRPSAALGCPSCKWSRCSTCCTDVKEKKGIRKEQEWCCLDPIARLSALESSEENTHWEVCYYDSLSGVHKACSNDAQAVLTALRVNWGLATLKPQNQVFQKGSTECGYWVAHYIEEECRRALGEPAWSTAFNLKERAKKVIGVRAWLQKRN